MADILTHLKEAKKNNDEAVNMLNDKLFGVNYKDGRNTLDKAVVAQIEIARAIWCAENSEWHEIEKGCLNVPAAHGKYEVLIMPEEGDMWVAVALFTTLDGEDGGIEGWAFDMDHYSIDFEADKVIKWRPLTFGDEYDHKTDNVPVQE